MPTSGGVIYADGQRILNFSSNDYLDLAHHPAVTAAARVALNDYGAGSTASRLVTGTLPPHEELERQLASHKGYPAALLFGSGYLTNAGAITSLLGRGDTLYADRLAHASILDAGNLSRARVRRFRHNDPDHLDELLGRHRSGRALVATESVFSMDGDLAPLPALVDVAASHGAALLVDEAHATGVFGPGGAGCLAEHGLQERVEVAVGTLGKALGSYGGYTATSAWLRDWFVQRARSFIYSTALPPAAVGAALGALETMRERPLAGADLLGRAARFRDRLQSGGLDVMASASQIIPIQVGTNACALRLATRLREQAILAIAIRPPTVPEGTARLRLSVTLAHSEDDLAEAADRLVLVAREEGVA
jgi:8-amino-7-oxononanoate synthase